MAFQPQRFALAFVNGLAVHGRRVNDLWRNPSGRGRPGKKKSQHSQSDLSKKLDSSKITSVEFVVPKSESAPH